VFLANFASLELFADAVGWEENWIKNSGFGQEVGFRPAASAADVKL
jgi:hypothetical protein